VTATALDGRRAEAFVREFEGVARAVEDGFVPVLPVSAPPPKVRPPQRPAGKVKNGFTTLP
jgi:hypothetical protein